MIWPRSLENIIYYDESKSHRRLHTGVWYMPVIAVWRVGTVDAQNIQSSGWAHIDEGIYKNASDQFLETVPQRAQRSGIFSLRWWSHQCDASSRRQKILYPNKIRSTIVTEFKIIRGTLITVRTERTRFIICDLIPGSSPKPPIP